MAFKMLISQFEIGFFGQVTIAVNASYNINWIQNYCKIFIFENNKIDNARNEHQLSNVYCLCRMLSLLENICYADIQFTPQIGSANKILEEISYIAIIINHLSISYFGIIHKFLIFAQNHSLSLDLIQHKYDNTTPTSFLDNQYVQNSFPKSGSSVSETMLTTLFL